MAMLRDDDHIVSSIVRFLLFFRKAVALKGAKKKACRGKGLLNFWYRLGTVREEIDWRPLVMLREYAQQGSHLYRVWLLHTTEKDDLVPNSSTIEPVGMQGIRGTSNMRDR